MVIFKNVFLKLDYDPVTDILSAEMPDVDVVTLPEIKRLLSILVEHVRIYDVKKLLIDARKTQVNVDEESYTVLIGEFLKELMDTRLQKLARIVSNSTIREGVVRSVYDERKFPVKLESFTEVPMALEWLNQ